MGCSSSKAAPTPAPDTSFTPIVLPGAAGLEQRVEATKQRQTRLEAEVARLADARAAREAAEQAADPWGHAVKQLDARVAEARAAGQRKLAARNAALEAAAAASGDAGEVDMLQRLRKKAAREARHIDIATAEGVSVNALPYDEVEDVAAAGGSAFDAAAAQLRGRKHHQLIELRADAVAAAADGNAAPFVLRRAVALERDLAPGAPEVAHEPTSPATLRETLADAPTFYDASAHDFSRGRDAAWGAALPDGVVAADKGAALAPLRDEAAPLFYDASAHDFSRGRDAAWGAALPDGVVAADEGDATAGALRGAAFDEAPHYTPEVESFTMKSKGQLRPVPAASASSSSSPAPSQQQRHQFAAWGPGLPLTAVARDAAHKTQQATFASRQERAARGAFPVSAAAARRRLARGGELAQRFAAVAVCDGSDSSSESTATIKVLAAADVPAIVARHAAAEAEAQDARAEEGAKVTLWATEGKFAKPTVDVTLPAFATPAKAKRAAANAANAAATTPPATASPAGKKKSRASPRIAGSPAGRKAHSPSKVWDVETTASKGRFDMQSLRPFSWSSSSSSSSSAVEEK
jgi:hypothetical protein